MFFLALLLLLSAPAQSPVHAQPVHAQPVQTQPAASDTADVRAVIDGLFDAMRAGDGEAVRRVFDDGATLETVRPAPDSLRDATGQQTVVQSGSVDEFADAVSAPKDAVWDERIWDVEIRVDGPMASAWVPYAFYLGDTLHHCGVNAIQLVRRADGWKMRRLIDTRTPAEDCER